MTNRSENVKFEHLRKLYGQNQAARAILDHLASRERNWSSTTVERIQENVRGSGYDISRGEVISTFKELEEAGCGKFMAGRRGWASRFEWTVEMVGVGRAAAGETDQVDEVSEEESGDEQVGDLLKHAFRLRADVPVTFELPSDLTVAEATRLADFVKTLPFGD